MAQTIGTWTKEILSDLLNIVRGVPKLTEKPEGMCRSYKKGK